MAQNRRGGNPPGQMALFADPRQCRQKSETPAVYDAVLLLRRSGMTVYAASHHQHKVGDRLVSSRQLLKLATMVPPPDELAPRPADKGSVSANARQP